MLYILFTHMLYILFIYTMFLRRKKMNSRFSTDFFRLNGRKSIFFRNYFKHLQSSILLWLWLCRHDILQWKCHKWWHFGMYSCSFECTTFVCLFNKVECIHLMAQIRSSWVSNVIKFHLSRYHRNGSNKSL